MQMQETTPGEYDMNVGDLIKRLSAFNADLPVYRYYDDTVVPANEAEIVVLTRFQNSPNVYEKIHPDAEVDEDTTEFQGVIIS